MAHVDAPHARAHAPVLGAGGQAGGGEKGVCSLEQVQMAVSPPSGRVTHAICDSSSHEPSELRYAMRHERRIERQYPSQLPYCVRRLSTTTSHSPHTRPVRTDGHRLAWQPSGGAGDGGGGGGCPVAAAQTVNPPEVTE